MKFYISLLFLTLAAASCLEDEGYTDLANGVGNDKYILSWSGALGTPANTILDLPAKESYDYSMSVTLSSTSAPQKDYAVHVTIDESIVDEVNASLPDADKFMLMPDEYYDIIQDEVQVKAGQRDASYTIRFYPNVFDKAKSFMLPLVLTAEDESVVVSGNAGTAKLALIGNPYAGTYASAYHFKGETAPGVFTEVDYTETKTFAPIDSKELFVYYAGFARFANTALYFKISVNDNNTVNIISALEDGSSVAIIPTAGEVSTYDPATKTFHLYYEYVNASGLARRFDDVCVLQ